MKKIIIISSAIVGTGLITGLIIVPAVRKRGIRKRLNEAYNDPAGYNSAGGLDKLLVTEAFDPDRYNSSNSHETITLVEARERAKTVWENYSWLGSNQSAIIGAFTGLGHVDDVSKISHEFTAQYDEDLLETLKEALSDKAKYNLLIGKINKLPKN